MANDNPPPAFNFTAEFGIDGGKNHISGFQEVSGLSVQPQAEDVREGGENSFTYQLPTTPKHSNVSLKRGIISDPIIIAWIKDVLYSDMSKPIKPVDVVIALQNEKNKPVAKWKLMSAWPVKIETSSMSSIKNDLAIESLEFSYETLTRLS